MANVTLSAVFEKMWQSVKTALNNKADKNHSHSNYETTDAAQAKLTEAKTYTDTKTSGTLSSDRLPTVPVTKGGTNATTAADARTNLGITPANIGAAAASHGNHVPTTESANNAKFLRNDNTWQTVTPDNIGAVKKSGDTMSGALQVPKLNIDGKASIVYNSTLNAFEFIFD